MTLTANSIFTTSGVHDAVDRDEFRACLNDRRPYVHVHGGSWGRDTSVLIDLRPLHGEFRWTPERISTAMGIVFALRQPSDHGLHLSETKLWATCSTFSGATKLAERLVAFVEREIRDRSSESIVDITTRQNISGED